VIGVMTIGALAAFVGYWILDLGGPKRFCGAEAHTQLRSAIDEMSSVIPASTFTVMDDCDSGSEVYAVWEVDDLDTILTNARAFGCRVNDSGLRNDESEFLNCDTSTLKVVFYLDPPWAENGAGPASGSMQRVA